MFTRTAEPYAGSPFPATGSFFNFSVFSLTTEINLLLSITSILLCPRTTIAFSFLEPITAPTPPLAAARWPLFIMAENFTRFSPAGPIDAICTCLSPNSSVKIFSVSLTLFPQTCEASFNSTLSSSIRRYTGFSLFPSTIIMSQPDIFSSAPKNPPELAMAIIPVSGLFVITMYLPPVGAVVPVSAPVVNIILFSSLRASTFGSISFRR